MPRRVTFRTQPRLGLDLPARIERAGHVPFDWRTCDEGDGRAGAFLAELGQRRQLGGAVPVPTPVWAEDAAAQLPDHAGRGRHPVRPARDGVRSVAAVARALPADAWEVRCLREGSGSRRLTRSPRCGEGRCATTGPARRCGC